MEYLYDYAVIDGDLRQVYLAEELAAVNRSVIFFGLVKTPKNCSMTTSLEYAIHSARHIVGPTPLLKKGDVNSEHLLSSLINELNSEQSFFAGCIPKELAEDLADRGVFVYDLMENNALAVYNTIATAEGAICEALLKSPKNLHHSKCAILGYGRCGHTLANYLKGMFCDVYVCANSEDKCALAETVIEKAGDIEDFRVHAHEFDYVFNTIPAKVLTEPILERMKPAVTIIDIASAPGGVDYEAAARLGLNASLCPGLPGKYSPLSCAEAIKNIILRSENRCL